MKCEHCREWLNQYIDYELSVEESAWVEEHISVCKACRQEYNELVYTKQASLSIPDFIPPKSFTQGWRAAVSADMAPLPIQTQPAAKPVKNTGQDAYQRSNGLQRAVRSFVLIAAVLGVGFISVQAYNHISALFEGNDIAKAPFTAEQIEGGNAGLQQNASPEQKLDSGSDVGMDSADDAQAPESTTFGNDEENSTENGGDENSLMPKTGGTLDPLGSMTPSGAGEDGDAHSAINGVKEVMLSAPVDKEMIESSLDKENVVYKIFEDVYVIEVDNSNIRPINKVLNDLGSTETMVAGETLHIKLR